MTTQGQRFRRRALRRGYKVDEVDLFLDRVEATMAGEPVDRPVTAQDVRDVVFRVRFGGYDEWQVDLHLDRVERQLAEAQAEAELQVGMPPDRLGPRPGPPPGPGLPPGPEAYAEPGYGRYEEPTYGGYDGHEPGRPGQGMLGPGPEPAMERFAVDATSEMHLGDPGGPGGPMGPGGPGGPMGPGGMGGPGMARPGHPEVEMAGPGMPGSRMAGGPPGPPPDPYAEQREPYPDPREPYQDPREPYQDQREPYPPDPREPYPDPRELARPGPGLPDGAGMPVPGPGSPGVPGPGSGGPAGMHGPGPGGPGAGAPGPGGRGPAGPPPSGPGYAVAQPDFADAADPDVRRVDELRRGFQPRRFGSGYDRTQVDRLFDQVMAGVAGQGPLPAGDADLDPGRFDLVSGGYFEDEVDRALREVRDILRRR